jgi:hypothetical protein
MFQRLREVSRQLGPMKGVVIAILVGVVIVIVGLLWEVGNG